MADSFGDWLATPDSEAPTYNAKVEFTGRTATIETGNVEVNPEQPVEYEEILRSVGRDPARWRLVSIDREKFWQVPYRPIEGYDDNGKPIYGELDAKLFTSKTLTCELIDDDTRSDLELLIAQARKATAIESGLLGSPYWYVFQAGDLQLGKVSRDGSTEQIVERFTQSVERAKRQLRAVAALGVAGVQISMPGDCIEGNQSQQGRNSGYLTREAITEQTRVLRRLMLYAIDELAGANEVKLHVVNGNHDQAQRQLNTWPGDGWATEQAIAVSDALKLNPAAYSHVEVKVPEKWSGYLTEAVGDTVVTVVHGHQFGLHKGLDWLAKQAVHNQPAGATHVLQHGHRHTVFVERHATKAIICSPTFELNSDYYRERHGADSIRGALTYLLRAGEFSKLGVV
ncbi:MRE11 double-strand break endo/exonuclease [Mycobacterium Phage Nergal]|nr:MRE11 double-strand break endo/exonuclease [Mycobacterium Phage Nergal]